MSVIGSVSLHNMSATVKVTANGSCHQLTIKAGQVNSTALRQGGTTTKGRLQIDSSMMSHLTNWLTNVCEAYRFDNERKEKKTNLQCEEERSELVI